MITEHVTPTILYILISKHHQNVYEDEGCIWAQAFASLPVSQHNINRYSFKLEIMN